MTKLSKPIFPNWKTSDNINKFNPVILWALTNAVHLNQVWCESPLCREWTFYIEITPAVNHVSHEIWKLCTSPVFIAPDIWQLCSVVYYSIPPTHQPKHLTQFSQPLVINPMRFYLLAIGTNFLQHASKNCRGSRIPQLFFKINVIDID